MNGRTLNILLTGFIVLSMVSFQNANNALGQETIEDHLLFRDSTEYSNGSVNGMVLHEGGPDSGLPVINGSVEILNGSGETVNTTSTGEDGSFRIGSIPFGYNYTVKARPPENRSGEWESHTGYLISTSSPFDITNGSGLEVNLKLKYYEYTPPPVHPSVEITDDSGKTVQGVKVVAETEEKSYVSHTNTTGVAVFYQYDNGSFPDGTTYSASKYGYVDITWDEGEEVPEISSEEDEDPTTILVIIAILLLVFIVIMAGALFLSGDRK